MFSLCPLCFSYKQLYGLNDPQIIETGILRMTGVFFGLAVATFVFYFIAVSGYQWVANYNTTTKFLCIKWPSSGSIHGAEYI